MNASPQAPDDDPLQIRLRRINRKLNLLIVASGLQLCMLVVSTGSLFFPSRLTLLLIGLLVITLGIMFRKKIPGGIRSLIRWGFSRFHSEPGLKGDKNSA